jgi:hypothetical protein
LGGGIRRRGGGGGGAAGGTAGCGKQLVEREKLLSLFGFPRGFGKAVLRARLA